MDEKKCPDDMNAFHGAGLLTISSQASKEDDCKCFGIELEGKMSEAHECTRGCNLFSSCVSGANASSPADEQIELQNDSRQERITNLEDQIEELTKTIQEQKGNLQSYKILVKKQDIMILQQKMRMEKQNTLITQLKDVLRSLLETDHQDQGQIHDEIINIKERIREAELNFKL